MMALIHAHTFVERESARARERERERERPNVQGGASFQITKKRRKEKKKPIFRFISFQMYIYKEAFSDVNRPATIKSELSETPACLCRRKSLLP
jgi:hypothetical protein